MCHGITITPIWTSTDCSWPMVLVTQICARMQ
ncbi:Uncharacterised protein [Segatella copri]|nr:Uncharacterised protein [Segatella copri]